MRNPIHVIGHWLATRGVKRSPEWPAVRKSWLRLHPNCAACNGTKNVEVHHIKSFHLYPELELCQTNFISLCERIGQEDHLDIGHTYQGKRNWKINNPDVVMEARRKLHEVLNEQVHDLST